MSVEADAPVVGSMHTFPKTFPVSTTVGQAREFFRNDKVHALLVVSDGVLIAVVERPDLFGRADHEPVVFAGQLGDRVVAPSDSLHETRDAMAAAGRRRVAVATEEGRLVGLLCLKRSGRGFCSDAGIGARAEERAPGRRCAGSVGGRSDEVSGPGGAPARSRECPTQAGAPAHDRVDLPQRLQLLSGGLRTRTVRRPQDSASGR